MTRRMKVSPPVALGKFALRGVQKAKVTKKATVTKDAKVTKPKSSAHEESNADLRVFLDSQGEPEGSSSSKNPMAKAAKSPKSKAAALKRPVAAVGAKAVASKRPAAAVGVKAVALKRPFEDERAPRQERLDGHNIQQLGGRVGHGAVRRQHSRWDQGPRVDAG